MERYTEAIANADIAFSNENYAAALRWLREVLEERPEDITALRKAGTVCLQMKDIDGYQSYFLRAVEADPRNGDNYFHLGNAFFFKNEYARAFECYAIAEQQGVSEDIHQKLYYQLAMICSAKQDIKAALVNFKKCQEADPTGMTALDPAIIAEQIKLYAVSGDYRSAEREAIKLISVTPGRASSYLVYYTILVEQSQYAKAAKVLEDAEKYAELTDDERFSIRYERAVLLASQAETDAEHAPALMQEAYAKMQTLCEEAPPARRDEVMLVLAEICNKMGKTDEAIRMAADLLPKEPTMPNPAAPMAPRPIERPELSEDEIEAMAEEDMDRISEMIANGDLSSDMIDSAEVYYDEDGKEVREYPKDAFPVDPIEVPPTTEPLPAPAPEPAVEHDPSFYDKVYNILVNGYVARGEFDKAMRYSGLLKHSSNLAFAYLGRYAEAYAMRRLSETGAYTEEAVAQRYAELIAYFRRQMFVPENRGDAVKYRARAYADIGKLVKAQEMADLLPDADREEIMAYIGSVPVEH